MTKGNTKWPTDAEQSQRDKKQNDHKQHDSLVLGHNP